MEVMVETSGEVSVVMRYAVCWGVHQGARGARFEWLLELGESNVFIGRSGYVFVKGRRSRSG
jgi:hypothetical protein